MRKYKYRTHHTHIHTCSIGYVHVTCKFNGMAIIGKPFRETILFFLKKKFLFHIYSPWNICSSHGYVLYCTLKFQRSILVLTVVLLLLFLVSGYFFYFFLSFFLFGFKEAKKKWFASLDLNESILFHNYWLRDAFLH